jgi:hypothetical protein
MDFTPAMAVEMEDPVMVEDTQETEEVTQEEEMQEQDQEVVIRE